MAGRDPVAGVYAKALVDAAQGQNALDGVEEAFTAFMEAFRTLPEFRTFLAAPNVPSPAKKDALTKALAGAPATFVHFLCLLVDKGRLASLPGIHEVFRSLRDEASGRVRAKATTAAALSPQQSGGVRTALAEKLKREVVLEETVKPEILGGIRLQIGDWVADGTLQRRLRDLSREVAGARPPEGAWVS